PRNLGEIFRIAYPGGHPMARVPPANVLPLASVTLEAARKFVAEPYQPRNITVVIAGDVNPQVVSQLIERWNTAVLEQVPGRSSAPRTPARLSIETFPPRPPESSAVQRLVRPVAGRRLLL